MSYKGLVIIDISGLEVVQVDEGGGLEFLMLVTYVCHLCG